MQPGQECLNWPTGALSRARAIRELKNGRGTQFDPALVDSFLKLVKDLD